VCLSDVGHVGLAVSETQAMLDTKNKQYKVLHQITQRAVQHTTYTTD